jgi:hypothetical protein
MTMQPGFADLALPDLRLRVGDDALPENGAIDVEDPCTGAVFAQVPVAGEAAVDAAVAAARAALVAPAWRDLARWPVSACCIAWPTRWRPICRAWPRWNRSIPASR